MCQSNKKSTGIKPEPSYQYGEAGVTSLSPQLPHPLSFTKTASRIMRLTNLLVSAFLCLATVAALVTHLEARDDSLATFTYEVHNLCLTIILYTDRFVTGGTRYIHSR